MPYANNRGVSVFYEVSGEGTPFVMLHANPCDHRMWMFQAARFSNHFKVIAPDMRAYGRTDKPLAPYAFSALVDDVLAVCKKENVQSGILAGASMGSKIAFQLLSQARGLFQANIQVGGNAFRGSSYDQRIEGYKAAGDNVQVYRENHLKELFAPGFTETDQGKYLASLILNDSDRLSGSAIATLFQSFDEVDLVSDLPKIEIPTLIVNGEFDNSLKGGKMTSERIQKATHQIIEDAGHLCILEQPDHFDRLVSDFLSQNDLL